MQIKKNEKQVYLLEAILIFAIIIFAFLFLSFLSTIGLFYLVAVLGITLIAAIKLFDFHRDKHYLRSFASRIIIASLLSTLIICYSLGLFLNFTYSSFSLSLVQIAIGFLPALAIAIETEILRHVIFRAYYHSKRPIYLFTAITIFFNIIMSLNSASFVSTEAVFLTICTAVFPVIATELLCSYLCLDAGLRPALIYKIAAKIYIYVLPILPNLGPYLYIIVSLVLPTVIFLLVYNSRPTRRHEQKTFQRRSYIALNVPIIIALCAIVTLVSGIFKYQIAAIVSDSMSPTFSRGDAVIIEKTSADAIQENDILVFKHDGNMITHRVVKITNQNDHYVFTTRGDHNNADDSFTTQDTDVIGRVVIIDKYIGFPTVWLNELLTKGANS